MPFSSPVSSPLYHLIPSWGTWSLNVSFVCFLWLNLLISNSVVKERGCGYRLWSLNLSGDMKRRGQAFCNFYIFNLVENHFLDWHGAENWTRNCCKEHFTLCWNICWVTISWTKPFGSWLLSTVIWTFCPVSGSEGVRGNVLFQNGKTCEKVAFFIKFLKRSTTEKGFQFSLPKCWSLQKNYNLVIIWATVCVCAVITYKFLQKFRSMVR